MDNPPKGIWIRLTEFVFYGNYFYGLCVAALILETTVQLAIPYNGLQIYIASFAATVLFYNYPYARNLSPANKDPRTRWYFRNHRLVKQMQVILTIVLLLVLGQLAVQHGHLAWHISVLQWCLLGIFPLAGALYYGNNIVSARWNLRRVGWLKPFMIGFVWAGIATIYPVWFDDVLHGREFKPTLFLTLLFVKNLMFVSVLAIMFDIKDYAGDSRKGLDTLVVKMGLRKTILYVLLPLPLLGLLTFISYAVSHHFSILKMVLIMLPFLLLLLVARSLRKRRTLLYYLVVIDGLFIVKALFDIVAMLV
jgi:4-hydroxybenzoate polyprenyltransferase